jgi:aminoglycoside phosphotransferase (APT) family kinase protein
VSRTNRNCRLREIGTGGTDGRAKIAAVDMAGISPAVAARLVAEQFPQWADLPVERVAIDGWDNATFRLGDALSVRLPSADRYVAQVDKEHRWLPVLARHLPLPIPEPVALGQPSARFPRPWSIYRWIEGGPAGLEPIADLTRFAADLAEFLGALYVVDANDGPSPGWHNFFRGGSLGTWTFDKDTRRSIELLADEIDAEAATEAWEAALGSAWDRPPVWVHGDVVASNLLVVDGTLRAVIDFGCAGVGDPACDLVMMWNFFTGDSRDEFRRGLPFDDATWARARGWALWKALRTMAREHERGEDPLAAARRFGWRCSPREVIDLVVADHDGSV